MCTRLALNEEMRYLRGVGETGHLGDFDLPQSSRRRVRAEKVERQRGRVGRHSADINIDYIRELRQRFWYIMRLQRSSWAG